MATDVKLKLRISAEVPAEKPLKDLKSDLEGVATAGEKVTNVGKQMGAAGAAGVTKMATAADKLKVSMEKAKAAGDTMVAVGSKMAVIGGAMAAAAFFPVKAASDFESAMSGVEAVTAGFSDLQTEVTNKAKQLGRETKFSATDAAAGMKFLGMAGLEADEVIDAIGPSLNLAAAGALELAEAADVASNIMSAFQLKAEDLGHVTDVLAQTATSSNTSVRQLAEAMSYAAPVAASMGISVEETAAVLGVLGNNGIQASMAGTTLRGMLLSLAAPTAQAQAAMSKLGVTISKNEDGTIDLAGTMLALGEANMTATEASAIFRRTAAAGAIAISKQTDELKKLTDANNSSEGAAKRLADILKKNLGGAIKELMSAIESFLIEAGSPLLETLTKIVKITGAVVTKLGQFAAKNPKLVSSVVAVVGGLGVLTLTLSTLAIGAGIVVSSLATLNLAFIKTGIGSRLAAKGVLTLSFAMKALGASMVVAFALIEVAQALKILFDIVQAHIAVRKAQKRGEQQVKDLVKAYQEFNKQTGLNVKNTEEFHEAIRKNNLVLDHATGQWRRMGSAAEAMAFRVTQAAEDVDIASDVMEEATTDTSKEMKVLEANAKKAYEVAIDMVEKYGKKVLAWNKKIDDLARTTEDKIRGYRRKTMDDHAKWLDREAQAEEKLVAADIAMYEGRRDAAETLLKEAGDLFDSLATKVVVKDKKFEEEEKRRQELRKQGWSFEEDRIAKVFGKEKAEELKKQRLAEDVARRTKVTMEQGVEAAISGQERVKAGLTSLYELQRKEDEDTVTKFKERAAEIKQTLDEVLQARDLDIMMELANIVEINQALEDWVNQEREITIKIKKIELPQEDAPSIIPPPTKPTPPQGRPQPHISPMSEITPTGFLANLTLEDIIKGMLPGAPGLGRQQGGSIPGWGGGDKVKALLEPGEFVMRKEAVKKYGNALFDSLNSMQAALPNVGNVITSRLGGMVSSPRVAYQTGGAVGGMGIRDLGKVDIQLGSKVYPVMGESDVLDQLKREIERENMVRSN